jgi:hypothetical protein
MFACSVSMHLSAGSVTEFTQVLKQNVVPLLRRQKGFRGHIAFVLQDGTEALGISLWDSEKNAEGVYDANYPERLLMRLVEGTLLVRLYYVSNTTFSRIKRLEVRESGPEETRDVRVHRITNETFRTLSP